MIGNPGWSFDDLVPYFKKSQSHTPQDNEILPGTGAVTAFDGLEGPVKVRLSFTVVLMTAGLRLIHRLPTIRGIHL